MAVLVQQSTTRALGEDVLVQHSTIGALERFYLNYMSIREALLVQQCSIGVLWLCWYSRVPKYHRSTWEAVLVQKSTKGALQRLCRCSRVLKEHTCWYSRILKGHSGCCTGTAEYYMSTREAKLIQQGNIGTLGCLCWCSRIL